MPVRTVPGTDVQYYLVVFDEQGKERREPDGTLMSETVRARVADQAAPITDVFFTSHGWKGDVPAAIEQYDAWIGAMQTGTRLPKSNLAESAAAGRASNHD